MSLDKKGVVMPLVEAMLNYKNEDVYPLHTPGHGRAFASGNGRKRAHGCVADE